MPDCFQTGFAVQSSGKYRQIATGTVPKQVRATDPAKPALRRFGRLIPCYIAINCNITAINRSRRHIMPAGFAALLAMTCHHRAHWPRDPVFYRPAQTTTCFHDKAFLFRIHANTKPTSKAEITSVTATDFNKVQRLAIFTVSLVRSIIDIFSNSATAAFSR